MTLTRSFFRPFLVCFHLFCLYRLSHVHVWSLMFRKWGTAVVYLPLPPLCPGKNWEILPWGMGGAQTDSLFPESLKLRQNKGSSESFSMHWLVLCSSFHRNISGYTFVTEKKLLFLSLCLHICGCFFCLGQHEGVYRVSLCASYTLIILIRTWVWRWRSSKSQQGHWKLSRGAGEEIHRSLPTERH